jgi:hypothetical protein
MSSLFIEKNSPFFRFASVINLGNIEKEKSWEEISVSRENVRLIMSIVQMRSKVYSDLKSSGINVSRAIKSLTQNGTITKTDSGYELTDPLLNYWIEPNVMKNI